MRKFLLALALVLFTLTPAQAGEAMKAYLPDAELVGEGRMRVFMMDIYDAALFAPGGDAKPGEPVGLTLTYLRDIEGKKIADHSFKEMKKLKAADEATLKNWHALMLDIFPDVREGMSLSGILTPKGETVFLQDGKKIAQIKDKNFGPAFFDIWLNPKTSAPNMRRKLLGEGS